ncbi:hypothetical protein LMH87_006770 [Akanthomyces muscarius]|uniref:Uncharacterized protein n=1 Tax=Akanthomyces muscarius TaxID=2231603 RepID=A0A9W8QRG0_AKAMU|nr:hypothetical protein LMH87_006770 [Akanthomyces muscarius]KAJ4165124.1 hypothetical protein LMH87_006770 [Akanthomyces muscarius]
MVETAPAISATGYVTPFSSVAFPIRLAPGIKGSARQRDQSLFLAKGINSPSFEEPTQAPSLVSFSE